jgi:glyoxylase-like metal-dependent hydrolase (beta-lactamase superfamily II)
LISPLRPLTEHIASLAIPNATRSNIYVVREADDVYTLVDPGPVGTAPAILALDRKGTVRLARAVVTHAHPAHAGALARVVRGTGIPAYVSAEDARYLDGSAKPLLPRGTRGQLMAALGRVIELCPPVYKLERLRPGDPVGSLLVLPAPGHTPGSVCLYHPEDRALLTGDAVLHDGTRLHLAEAELSSDPEAAHKGPLSLRGLPVDHLLPGHGPPLLSVAAPKLSAFLERLAS